MGKENKQVLIYDVSSFPHYLGLNFDEVLDFYYKGVLLWDSSKEYPEDEDRVEPKVVNANGAELKIIDMAKLSDKEKNELLKLWRTK